MIKENVRKILLFVLTACMLLAAAFAALFTVQTEEAYAASDPVLTDT